MKTEARLGYAIPGTDSYLQVFFGWLLLAQYFSRALRRYCKGPMDFDCTQVEEILGRYTCFCVIFKEDSRMSSHVPSC